MGKLCTAELSLSSFLHISGDSNATHLTLIDPPKKCLSSKKNLKPKTLCSNPFSSSFTFGYGIRASSFLTCIRENKQTNQQLRDERVCGLYYMSYELLVDVPLKKGGRMALPRGAIKVDFVPDLILGLHAGYFGVVFRQCWNNNYS